MIPGGADATSLIARMESVPFSRWHAKARVIMGSATFFDAFNSLSLAFALPILIGLWHISPRQSGLLIASSYAGQLAGALLFSWLAEKFGRIPSATAGIAIMAVMTLGCAISASFPALFACRFVQGIGIGGEMPVAAAYISELSRARGRGRFFLLYEMIFPVGLMAAGQLGAWLVPAFGWQAIFLIGSIPCLIITVLVARLPESPRWLISQGRLLEANAVVKQMEASAGTTVSSAPPIATPLIARTTRWSELVSASYRSRTLIAWTLWFCAYFIANSLNNWLPSLYNTVYHLGLRPALRAASLTNVAQVIVLLLCAFSIDRIGRRNWTVASFLAGAVLLGTLGFLASGNVSSVMILATFSYGIIGSTNAVLYLYTPEIYPTRMRAIGTGLATSWLRLASAVGPALVGFMVGAKGIGAVFLMFAAVSIVGALAGARMIETRGQRLEEIAA
ncbi:MAG TPA: MFS transporter [Bryobacteraceae bacterium]|nr:MFS transporter [Bryobacteraceae bacterium]